MSEYTIEIFEGPCPDDSSRICYGYRLYLNGVLVAESLAEYPNSLAAIYAAILAADIKRDSIIYCGKDAYTIGDDGKPVKKVENKREHK